jgi:ABC-type glycerol-3-phosphate transport system permease component
MPRPSRRPTGSPPHWPRHAIMIVVSFLMLIPFYWVVKTSLTGENIYAYPPRIVPVDPHLFNYVDVWYMIPFARYLLNSVIVTAMAIAGSLLFNVAAGYALTKHFPGRRWVVMLLLSCMLIPFQATIIPAYLITSWLGVLDTWLGVALPLLSTIICIFVFKASFEAVPPSLIDAARVDGLSEWRIVTRILLPLSKSAIATNVILTFIWSWNAFLWPLIAIRTPEMQTLPLGLARFLSVMEDTTGALYAFVVLVLIPGLAIFLMAQKEFIRGLTSGATKG